MRLKKFLQIFGAITVVFTILPYIPIDAWWIRIFVSEHFRVTSVERGKDIDSDHFPIFVKLNYEPDGAREQKANPPTKIQLEKARAQIKAEKEEDRNGN